MQSVYTMAILQSFLFLEKLILAPLTARIVLNNTPFVVMNSVVKVLLDNGNKTCDNLPFHSLSNRV